MNKIYKVMYSKVKQCAVVVSEIAKSHGRHTKSSVAKSSAALTAAVLLALGAFSFVGMPSVQATDSLFSNDYVGTNYKKDDGSSYSEKGTKNYHGGGAIGVGSNTLGMNAIAGKNTVTIGDRDASAATESVYIGAKYDANNQVHPSSGHNVVSVGYGSDAAGTGSIAIGNGAAADAFDNAGKGQNPDANSRSIAIGYMATAKQNNIALGAGSIATEKASTAKALYTDQDAPTSYVSVGSTVIENGKPTLRRITNVADGAADTDVATIAQLNKVAAEKGTWKLTAGGKNSTTVDATNNTVDFSAAQDSKNGSNDYSNLTVSKGKKDNNVTIGLKKDVILGQAVSGEGGSLSVYQDPGSVKTTDEENGYDQLGSHTKLDGSTISIRYNNGTGDSDARGVVLGIANDSYADPNDSKKTVDSPLGYLYLQDGKDYYYIHGAMQNDTGYKGRLVYNSSESGYNYIANLDDGIKFSGDVVDTSVNQTSNTTADTRLNPVTESTTKNINTMSITGGIKDSSKLTNNNIGVVVTPTVYDGKVNNNVTSAGGLSIQLAKDLTGITSISNQPTSATTTTGAKIELGTNGTTISGGDVNVSSNKITNLKNGEADTDAATVGQVDAKIKAANKYYSVKDGVELTGFNTNENNLGASAIASMAAGYTTGTTGIASTVAGSYSGVIGSGLQGAAAVSVGTVNVNNNTDTSKKFSGVANSIVGQANMTTDSNAAIIVGAGNSVTNSYRELDKNALSAIKSAGSVSALKDALQAAVPKSGAQVMVMGGGNNVESAYMSQVVGVGNTVTGADSTYAEGTSTQYNYVDGFQNTLTNGKNDYIIGSNNSVTGDSIDKNQSNIVVGDNHTLINRKNNVVIGSADSSKELAASGAVVIGHNADVNVDNGVALGSDSVASVQEGQKGYDPAKEVENKTKEPWTSTKAAVSVGKADGSVTRQITGVAAGTNDTDAVNVAQIKKLASIDASNIGKNFKDGDVTANENAWGEALGTGTVTEDSKQLVTGGTVYNEVRPSKDGKYVKMSQTTGDNLLKLDDQVKQNAQNISDNTYTQGDGILMDKTKKTISVNKGDGLKFTEDHKLAVYTGNGLKIDNGAVAIKTSDSNLKVDSNGIGLSDKITIGSDKTKQVTIDGTNGEISGLTNTTWDSKADYSKSTKAATESQVDAAVKDAVKQAGENDIHVAAGSYAVNDQNQVSMNLVDKNNDTKGTVIITDVAKSSEMGDVSKLADGVKNAGGKTTTVVDAINNVNENVNSVDRKVGDLNYFEQNDGKTHTVTNGTSITKAIGDLDSAVQNATEQAGKHTIVSTKDTNLDVKNIAKDGEAANYQIALNQDLNVNTVTAKTVTTDNLTVNKSATIGGVTIANKTISGLDDTKIEKGSTNAVNAGTIWNELRPSGGTYINQNNTTAQNLTSLDTQVKKTSDLINSDGKTIKIGGSDAATKIDVNGKDGKGRVITGVVSDANDPTSAANVGYVNGVTAANTQQIYRDMNNAYGRLNNNINKAAAGSNALAALHPLDYDPDDKADFAVGYGHYRNANAAAVGAFYHPNENTMVNVGVSLGNGDPGFNAGVSFKVGRGGAGREAMSKTEMAKVINSQSKEIDALKKDNADKDKRIDALEQKMAEILAKLDKNGK